jgi:hypothetical protein
MRVIRPLPFVVLCAVFTASTAQAQYVIKVVETGVSYTASAGSIGTFTITSFLAAPSRMTTVTAFPASTSAGSGIFEITPNFITAATTTNSSIPGGTGNFTSFAPNPTSVSDSGDSFLASGSAAPGNVGIYTTAAGNATVPTAVVNNATPFPGGGTFSYFSAPAVAHSTTFFAGGPTSGSSLGIFSRETAFGGPLLTVADTTTPVPSGSGNFTSFADPTYGNTIPHAYGGGPSFTDVVFNGQGGGRFGVYRQTGGTISRVVDNTITPPSGAGPFTAFGATPAIYGHDTAAQVAFYGESPGRSGIYLAQSGTVTLMADTSTAVPGGAGSFASFLVGGTTPTATSVFNGRVVFQGTDSAGKVGVYAAGNGSVQKLVAVGDVIDGHSITAVSISTYAFNGQDAAVLLDYAGGEAIYRFQVTVVPEPASLLAAAAGFLLLGRTFRRQIRKSPGLR